VPWTTDSDGGPALVEFAGRACYQSWSKGPMPARRPTTATSSTSFDVGHFSVLEHASVSFYITGVSRSLTHEADPAPAFLLLAALAALRAGGANRGSSYRPEWTMTPSCSRILAAAADASRATYTELLAKLEAKFADQPNAVLRRKQARQAARAVAAQCHRKPASW